MELAVRLKLFETSFKLSNNIEYVEKVLVLSMNCLLYFTKELFCTFYVNSNYILCQFYTKQCRKVHI